MPARGCVCTSARAVHNRVVRRPDRPALEESAQLLGHLFGCSKAIARIFRQRLQDDDFQDHEGFACHGGWGGLVVRAAIWCMSTA